MGFLKFQTKQGKKYNILPIHIRAIVSEDNATRIYASIVGDSLTFVVNRPHADVESEIEKALAEEQEQSA